MKHNSSTGRRMVEALYDLESGTTFVRHPEKENEWLECGLLGKVLKGQPVASVTGNDECEVFASAPMKSHRVEPKRSRLMLTHQGHHSELERGQS